MSRSSITLKKTKLLRFMICWEKDLFVMTRPTSKLYLSVMQTIYSPKKITKKRGFGFKRETSRFSVTLLVGEIILFLEVLLALSVRFLNKSKKDWKNFQRPSIGICTGGMNNFWMRLSNIMMHMLSPLTDWMIGVKVINDLQNLWFYWFSCTNSDLGR